MHMSLLINFPDQSASFSYGVEFGRLLERIESGNEFIQNNGFPVRIENKQLLISTCKAYNYTCTLLPCDVEGWINFIGIKKTMNNN